QAPRPSVFEGDEVQCHEIAQRHLHRLHPLVLASGQDVSNLPAFSLTNEVSNSMSSDQDLEGGYTTAGGLRNQLLVEHRSQCVRQLQADLRLLLAGKHVDDAVESLSRVVGVKGGEDEVTCFRDRQ